MGRRASSGPRATFRVETQIPEGASLEQLDVDDDGTAVVKLSTRVRGRRPG